MGNSSISALMAVEEAGISLSFLIKVSASTERTSTHVHFAEEAGMAYKPDNV
jgi:hypothetical protein